MKQTIEQIPDNCLQCGLFKYCRSPFMPYSGEGQLKILIIGEAPGADEDAQGIQFVGRAGQHLRFHLSSLGLDLEKHFWKTNCIRCRPINNATPGQKELRLCKKFLLDEIKQLNPRKIICLGNIALKNVMKIPWSKNKKGITWWHGKIEKSKILDCYFMATYHPSYLIRRCNPILNKEFTEDLRKFIEL